MMANIAFYLSTLGYRGTTRAVLEYTKLLSDDHIVSILFDPCSYGNQLSIGTEILKSGVQLVPVNMYDVRKINSLDFDSFYFVTADVDANNRWIQDINAHTLIHQVGYQIHDEDISDKYAYTSLWQSAFLSGGDVGCLPYIIVPNNNNAVDMRDDLSIPQDSIVLGRHGGLDTWNLDFVNAAILKVLEVRSDIHFVFMNTIQFAQHSNIHFIEGTHNTSTVGQFINTCDAMIHARWEGETFGLACAEFLIKDKPVITWSQSRERNHILIGGQSTLFYNNELDLYTTLLHLNHHLLDMKKKLIPRDHLVNYQPLSVLSKLKYYLGINP